MLKHLLLLAGLLSGLSLRAQQLDHHDILLFSLTKSSGSSWQIGSPRFLTAFNPKGYNNQPVFMSPSELYLTVQAPDDTTQTEIYALDLLTRTRTRITQTATAEYSPALMPDGRHFSAVRVEEDGSQRLWAFPVNRSDNGEPVFPNIRAVGYYCWLRDTLAALFLVGENGAPHVLMLAGTRSQQLQRLSSNVGRCLQLLPDGRLAYVQKATPQTWFIKAYDPKTQSSEILVKTLADIEDFAVLSDGSFLAGQGSRLYSYQPGQSKEWKEIINLDRYGVTTISRLAVSKDNRLAIVVM